MMLFPFFGALFNGLSSPSNRWMFAVALPVSIGVSFLLTDYKTLTKKICVIFLLHLLSLSLFHGGDRTSIFINLSC